jgi:Protein of unknown function (DUF3306)
MAQDKENPLSRWSRLKREVARTAEAPQPAPRAADAPLPELPPTEQLGADSDFSAFMDARVDDKLRRLALKKLFSDPRFNLTDGLDVYSEDYTLLADLPSALVEKLEHVRRVLRRPDPEQVAEAETKAAAPQTQTQAPELNDAADGATPVDTPPERDQG